MTPLSSENGALQQAIAEATARLGAQILQEIAALYQAIDESQQLVQDVRHEPAVVHASQVVHAPLLLDMQAADEWHIAG